MIQAMRSRYLVWLSWPYEAFRLNEDSKRYLERFIRDGDTLETVDCERDFLDSLPYATHAIVWNFEREWFELAPNLRFLATPGAGRELLPSDSEMPEGVVRVNGGFHGELMGETVIAFIFAHARGLYHAYDFQRRLRPLGGGDIPDEKASLWPRIEMGRYCTRVAGTHAVILGYGRIGHACASRLEALGVKVTGIGRRNFSELDGALQSADWVIMALPGDTGTDDIMDRRRISLLKPSAVIINVGRGNSIDEIALRDALSSGRLRAAYLDVFKDEPLKETGVLAGDIPGLYRMPHSSAFAPDYLPLFWEELERKGFFG